MPLGQISVNPGANVKNVYMLYLSSKFQVSRSGVLKLGAAAPWGIASRYRFH